MKDQKQTLEVGQGKTRERRTCKRNIEARSQIHCWCRRV